MLAIAQVAHVVVDDPTWSGVVTALGLFVILWWTWIGFALFFNRYGDESSTWQRLVVIVATIPCGIAAVAVHDVAHHDRVAFTLSLVLARLLLAGMHTPPFLLRNLRSEKEKARGPLPRRIALGYVGSALFLSISIFVPDPWWWILWTVAMVGESANVFSSEQQERRRRGERSERLTRQDLQNLQDGDASGLSRLRPEDPAYAVDSHHLAERFGLFMIILFGEIVASSGAGALSQDGHSTPWGTLAGAIALAGALWWIYFDASAKLNESLLELSGGSPEMARSIFATGHMVPASCLIVIAAGMKLLIEPDPPRAAYWLVAAGLGAYLVSTRVVLGKADRAALLLRLVLIIATFQLGQLSKVLGGTGYLWVVCGWALLCAYLASLGGRHSQAALGRA